MKTSSRHLFSASAAALAFGLAFVAVAQIVTPEEAASRNTRLTVNAKNLATGIMIYAADYDQTTIRTKDWTTHIVPYTKNPEIFTNPWRPGVPYAFGLNKGYAGIKARSFENSDKLVMVFTTSAASASSVGGSAELWRPTGYQKGVVAHANTHVKTYVKTGDVKADWKPVSGSGKKKAAPAKKGTAPKKVKAKP